MVLLKEIGDDLVATSRIELDNSSVKLIRTATLRLTAVFRIWPVFGWMMASSPTDFGKSAGTT
jgi:hypothetical protein